MARHLSPKAYALILNLSARRRVKGESGPRVPLNPDAPLPLSDALTEADLISYAGVWPHGEKGRLTVEDILAVRRFYADYVGRPLEDYEPPALSSRLETAKTFADEKMAREGVFERLLCFGGHSSIPMADGGSVQIPEGGVLCFERERIDAQRISEITVIENGALIASWEKLIPLLPENYQNTLLLYRGSGSNLTGLKSLLREVPAECEVTGYFDYDPAGFIMLKALKQWHEKVLCLLPAELPPEVTVLSKKEAFWDQTDGHQKTVLTESFPREIRDHIERMYRENLALTQENFLAHGVKLEAFAY